MDLASDIKIMQETTGNTSIMSLKQLFHNLKNVFKQIEYPYKSELQEPLKSPEDIIDAVEESKHSGDHAEIHNILKDRKINLSKHSFPNH